MAHPITRWLERQPAAVLTLYAVAASFAAYFCMYAFRKPFAAAQYDGLTLGASAVGLKTAFVTSQLIGYTLSKWIGVKVNAEMSRRSRARTLVAFIAIGHAALLGFALLPHPLKLVAIFVNGLPLGMVWGVLVTYLEGRRTSEMMLAGLSCSYIVASGFVKDAGRWLMRDLAVPEFWMPFATGALFLPVFLVAVWLLDKLPLQSDADESERHRREPMDGRVRRAFFARFWLGMTLLLVLYFFLTAFRDFRDTFGVELFVELGLGGEPAVFSRTEVPVGIGVLLVFGALTFVRDNRAGFLAAYAIMFAGMAIVGGATLAVRSGLVTGTGWMVLIGFGAYLTYVPYGSVLFDRLMAYTRATGTAVFAIYLMDAVGYTGSVFLLFFKDLVTPDMSRLAFFQNYCLFQSVSGVLLLAASGAFFVWRVDHGTER